MLRVGYLWLVHLQTQQFVVVQSDCRKQMTAKK